MEQNKPFINAGHTSAVQTFGHALTLGNSDAWLGAIRVFEARLTDHELTAAAYALLKAQNPENAALITDLVLGYRETPLPPLLSEMDDATFWADIADLTQKPQLPVTNCLVICVPIRPQSPKLTNLADGSGRTWPDRTKRANAQSVCK